jgi:hypothetical protein
MQRQLGFIHQQRLRRVGVKQCGADTHDASNTLTSIISGMGYARGLIQDDIKPIRTIQYPPPEAWQNSSDHFIEILVTQSSGDVFEPTDEIMVDRVRFRLQHSIGILDMVQVLVGRVPSYPRSSRANND